MEKTSLLSRFFSAIRSYTSELLPVKKKESPLVIFGCVIIALISFAFAATRGIKTTSIYEKAGSASYAVLKIATPFFMVLLKLGYDFMNKRVSRNTSFNGVFIFFGLVFTAFLFVLYPNMENWQLTTLAEWLRGTWFGTYFKHVIVIIEYWPNAIFFFFIEALGVYGLTVAFWGFMASISTIDQAKRLFPIVLVFGGLGSWVAGHIYSNIKIANESIIASCIVCFGLILFIYNFFIYAFVKKSPELYEVSHAGKKKKVKPSLKESFTIVNKDSFNRGIVIVIVAYTMLIVFDESLIRDWIKSFYTDKFTKLVSLGEVLAKDLNDKVKASIRVWNAKQLKYIGIAQIVSFFLIPFFRKRSWSFRASITPVVLLLGNALFFSIIFLTDSGFLGMEHFIGVADIGYVALHIALYTVVVGKTAKYITTDSTTEESLLMVEDHVRQVFKSSLGIMSRLGKALASVFIAFGIAAFYSNIIEAKKFIFIVIVGICIMWLWAIRGIAQEVHVRLSKKSVSSVAPELPKSSSVTKSTK